MRASGDVNVLDSFPQGRPGGGRGRAVITASNAMEYAFEGDRLADDQHRRPSVFTGTLVEGLATGDADRDEDGLVSLLSGRKKRSLTSASNDRDQNRRTA